MAEAIAVVTPVIEILLKLLLKEGKSFTRLHREVKTLKDELECIQGFLNDAEERSEKEYASDGVKAWLKQVREEAYHIEDVIDLYLLYMAQRLQPHGITGFLRRAGYFFKALKPRLNLVSEIEDIKASLCEIKDRGERYGFHSLPQGGSSSRATQVENSSARLGSLFFEENEFLDIHCTCDKLIKDLLEGTSTRKVISLTGMGGIGKTTLAKKVYDTKVVKAHFDLCAWITVTQSNNLERLLAAMAKQLCPGFQVDGIEGLIGCLRQFLETKRYVIVFDDVWELDFWGVIKFALPNNDNSSRIIVTTRNDMVAASCKDNSFDIVKKLQPLSEEMALRLFYQKAFRCDSKESCPPELANLSVEIVRLCQGLPLVISSIAGLLSRKPKILSEWEKLYITLNRELETNPQLSSIPKILFLSYHNLPNHLKPCYLYLGMFPPNFFILDFTLYRHWSAEGFVKEKEDKTEEQVAEEYLNELIQRNLVQAHGFAGGHKMCKIHDLMRNIVISRADELRFFHVVAENRITFPRKCRRLSFYCGTEYGTEFVEDFEVRSILLFNYDERFPVPPLADWFRRFKLLKVLSFRGPHITDLPENLGNLWHLKYISLRNTKVKTLPKSVGNLRNLEILDLKHTCISELPFNISKLQCLKHIYCFHNDDANEFSQDRYQALRRHKGIGSLVKLQTLMSVEVDERGVGLIKELAMLRQLRSVGILKLTKELGTDLCYSIQRWDHLEYLILISTFEDEILDLQAISSPPRFLWNLTLTGRLLMFPEWIPKLHNLRILSLFFSRLPNDPFNHLKSMPNLESLLIHKAYDGDEVHIKEGGFGKLKRLEMSQLVGLRVVKIDREALPLLEDLLISSCPELNDVPSNIQHLRSLRLVEFSEMPTAFVLGLQVTGYQCCWKIKRITYVNSWYESRRNVSDFF